MFTPRKPKKVSSFFYKKTPLRFELQTFLQHPRPILMERLVKVVTAAFHLGIFSECHLTGKVAIVCIEEC
jgi:hypothetical protein